MRLTQQNIFSRRSLTKVTKFQEVFHIFSLLFTVNPLKSRARAQHNKEIQGVLLTRTSRSIGVARRIGGPPENQALE